MPGGTRTRARTADRSSWSSVSSRQSSIVSDMVCARRLLDAFARLLDDRLYDRAQIAGMAVDVHLALRAGPVREDLFHVFHLAAAPQIVQDIVDELEQLHREIPHRHFAALAEIDQLAVDAPARGAPLVFFDQGAVIAAEPQVALAKAVQLHDDRLRQGGDGDRGARRRRHVADAELQRAEDRMRPEVPPDFLAVVDAAQLDERLDVLLVFGPRVAVIRDAG